MTFILYIVLLVVFGTIFSKFRKIYLKTTLELRKEMTTRAKRTSLIVHAIDH